MARHHHGTPERWRAQKPRFGHRNGSSPCAHSVSKFFLWSIVLSPLKLPPPARPRTTCIKCSVFIVFISPKQEKLENYRKVILLRNGWSRSPLCWWQAPCSQGWLPPHLRLLAHSRPHHFAPKIYLSFVEPVQKQVKSTKHAVGCFLTLSSWFKCVNFQTAEKVGAWTQQKYRHPHRTARRCQLRPLQWANDVRGQSDLRARWPLPCSLI